jgi:beta-lactamase regulating signal transducer with metallopeptidase domain/tetratricopeptide (TPR) repeat protein
MTNELTTFTQEWFTFALLLSTQLLLVLALRKPVRAWLGSVACYRLWLLPLLWLPFYVVGPALLAVLAGLFTNTAETSGYTTAVQQFMDIELFHFTLDLTGRRELTASHAPVFQPWIMLAAMWAGGTLSLVLWHGRRWLVFSRRVREKAVPLSTSEREFAGASRHFTASVPAVYSNEVNSAALFGVFKPLLLLPADFTSRYDSGQRHIILAHEAVHLRRGDNGWNLCALMFIALFWINPLLFIAWRYFRLDQELSCDALALARCNREQQARYARTLLDSLIAVTPSTPRPTLSAWDNLRDIKERSLMIKQHLRMATRPAATLVSLFSLTALGASMTIAFAELASPAAQAAEVEPLKQQVREQERAVERQARLAEEQARGVEQQARAVEQQQREVEQQARTVEQQQREVEQQARAVEQQQRLIDQEAAKIESQTRQVEQQARLIAQQTSPTAQERNTTRSRSGSEASRESEDGSSSRPVGRNTGRILTDAISLLNSEQFEEARTRLAELQPSGLNPFERSRVHQLLFNLEMHDMDYDGALEQIQLALESGGLNDQETAQMQYQQAQLYVKQERYAEAAPALERWIMDQPQPSSAAYYLLAASYYYMGQYEAALPNVETAVELGGDAPEEAWLTMLNAVYMQLERYDDAEPVATRLVELFPDKPAYRTQLEQLRTRDR